MANERIDHVAIGERIRRARLAKGYKQDVVGEYCEVNSKQISMIENGSSGISVPTLKRICELLEVSADYLLFGKKRADQQLQHLVSDFDSQQMDNFLEITRLIANIGGADIFLDNFMLLIQDYVCTLPGSYIPVIA